ncbi:MAG TPA: peptidylprolyl isomerase [Gaiellaceae bacterium]|nr:peptidylprolyl isomerase [Gaiellaceae bacterium]
MKIQRYLALPALIALVVALAACGGSSSTAKLGASDVAVVGGAQITKQQFDDLMQSAQKNYQAQGRKFPKTGTAEYSSIKSQAVTLLVQQTERTQKAKSLGISVSDKQVSARLDQIKKQYFGGSEKNYQAQLKKQGLTDAQVREQIKQQLIDDAITNKVTTDVKVSDAEVHAYYKAHPQSYVQPPSREVRHILVKTKKLADQIEVQLKNGASFAALAKKYSQDPGSKANGGKLTVSKGQTVPEFDRAAFSLKTNEISKPVHSTYGWHVIQALSPIKPAKTTPESQVAASIKQQLLQQKKSAAMNAWVTKTEKEYCSGSKVSYQKGFTPSPDPCETLKTQTASTSTAG